MVFKLIKQENLHFITDFNIYIFNFIEQIIIYIFRNNDIIGKNIRKFRELKGYSQEYIANEKKASPLPLKK